MYNENAVQYIVREKRTEAPRVVTLFLSFEDGTAPSFTSGQYVTVYFPDTHTPEGKAYSISSEPEEGIFSITVKNIGEFSNRLSKMEVGDKVLVSPPYGFFYPEHSHTDLVMLAAGIGITPFRSIIRDAKKHTPKRRLSLFYSSKTVGGTVFKEELDEIKYTHEPFEVRYFFTREAGGERGGAVRARRMNANDVLEQVRDTKKTEFLLCGSIPFVRDMWRELTRAGVLEETIYTEAFF